jgi:hypothetical protein
MPLGEMPACRGNFGAAGEVVEVSPQPIGQKCEDCFDQFVLVRRFLVSSHQAIHRILDTAYLSCDNIPAAVGLQGGGAGGMPPRSAGALADGSVPFAFHKAPRSNAWLAR